VSSPPAFATLQTKLGEIVDLVKTSALLGWDQQTQMPPLGAEARTQQLGTVGRLAHEAFVSDEIGALLEELRPYAESLDADSFEASLVRVVPARLRQVGSRAAGALARSRARLAGLRHLGGGAHEIGLRALPAGARGAGRAEAPLRRLLPACRDPVRHAARRLRARHEDGRGADDLRPP
jgi:hypothetical protein